MPRLTASLTRSPMTLDRPCILFFFLLILMVCRGTLEFALGKKLSMMTQFGGLIALLSFSFAPKYIQIKQKWLSTFILLFLSAALFSCLVTFLKTESLIWILYMAFNGGLLLMALFLIRTFRQPELTMSSGPALMTIGWLLLLVGVLEQFGLVRMTGSGEMFVIRPASLTGSFLHYPLVMGLIGLICIQNYVLHKTPFILLSSIVFCLSPFVSASRSGAMIVLAAIFIYPFFLPIRRSKPILLAYLLFFALLISLFFFFSKEKQSSLFHNLLYRLVSSVNTKSVGNSVRVEIWSRVVDEYLSTNLLLGEEAGKYTNSSNNMKAKKTMDLNRSYVTESSPLQLLMNFGLTGMILFYAILFQIPRFIHPEHLWLKATFWAAMAQTCVYQSIEVVPFALLLFFLPWISQSLNRELIS